MNEIWKIVKYMKILKLKTIISENEQDDGFY